MKGRIEKKKLKKLAAGWRAAVSPALAAASVGQLACFEGFSRAVKAQLSSV
jgi:hypothetical protein